MIGIKLASLLLLSAGLVVQVPSPVSAQSFFDGGIRLATGRRPLAVAVGDFNGDGQPDLACTNFVSNGITVFLGPGLDSATASKTVVTGTAPTGIASGDLNGDGFDDLVVSNTGSNNVSIILGDAEGSFANSLPPLSTGQSPIEVVVADLSGDGWPDIAVTNRLSQSVSVFINNGDETFSSTDPIEVGGEPLGLAAGRIDGDNSSDLVVANSGSDSISILLSRNNGSTFSVSQIAVSDEPVSVALADLNGDGETDLLVVSREAGTLTELRGDGTGSFSNVNSLIVGEQPAGLTVNDIEGDGDLDVMVSRYDADDAFLFLNDGTGNLDLAQQIIVGDGPLFLLLSDLDGDFAPELVSVNSLDNSLFIARNITRAKATIRFPLPGVGVAGRVAVVAQMVSGSPRRVRSVRFQFRPSDGSQPWNDIPASEATPNPDPFPPYAVFWDTSQLPLGDFLLRAIASDTFLGPDARPEASVATITDPATADEVETLTPDNLHEKIARVKLGIDNKVASTDSLRTNLTAIVDIPPEALTRETRLTMLFPQPGPLEGALRSFETNTGAFVQLTLEDPDAASDDFNATVQISYSDDDQDGILDGTNIDEKFMTIRHFDQAANVFRNIPTALITVDTEQNLVTATTRSFSTFGAMGIISGTLVGKVSRSGGQGINNAKVEAGGSGSPDILTTFSVDLGDYIIATAPIGTYDLNASATGFRAATRSAVTVGTGQTITTNFQLSTEGSGGDGDGNNPAPPCLLATFVRHTTWSALLDPLRLLRDSNLLDNPLASCLVQTYYRLSAEEFGSKIGTTN